MVNERILVSYCYYEKVNTKRNLDFFIRHGLYDNVHLIINIKNVKTNPKDLPNKRNITKISSKNEGWDFKGHLDNFRYMRSITNLEKSFDYVLIMNDSCIGPFILAGKWYTPFVEKLKSVEYVGIIKNLSWFNMFKISLLQEIEHIIHTSTKNTYNDAVKIEAKLSRAFTNDNITNTRFWNGKHSCFGAIFVKENRIGINTGTGKGKHLSYITPIELSACKFIMNIKCIIRPTVALVLLYTIFTYYKPLIKKQIYK